MRVGLGAWDDREIVQKQHESTIKTAEKPPVFQLL